MAGETKNGMQCAEFDALLNEALDATLTGPKLESFQAHARVCAVCGPLFAEADAGRRWLKSLPEVEPHLTWCTTFCWPRRDTKASASPSGPERRLRGWMRSPLAAAGVRSRAFHEPPAPLRHVIRNGVLLTCQFH